MKKKSRKQGFTLVEVLVVMAIVALLAATAIPKVKGIYEEAQLDKAEADAMQIAAAIQRVELKNELSGTPLNIVNNGDVLNTTDFEDLSIQIRGEFFSFRYSALGTLTGNTANRVIQIYANPLDLVNKPTPLREVMIPE